MRIACTLLLISCGTTLAAEATEIAVVHTWKELSATPEITLKNGARVRLGIEATEAPAGSHVLLYMLSDGDPGESEAHERLGPLKIQRDPDPREGGLQSIQEKSRADRPTGSLLWCARVWIEKGAVKISLLEGETAVAGVTVKSNGRTFHPWMSLRQTPGLREKAVADEERGTELTNKEAYCAMPVVDGTEPFAIPTDELRGSPQLLPHLLTPDDVDVAKEASPKPAQLDELIGELSSTDFETREAASRSLTGLGEPGLQALKDRLSTCTDPEAQARLAATIASIENSITASLSNGTLRLKFPKAVDVSNPKDCFLARWWVNGRPHISEGQDVLINGGGMIPNMRMADAISLRLKIDYAELKAKKADKITLQIMHAPDEYIYSSHGLEMAKEYHPEHDHQPRVSNKIEFKAP
jgi:hypothetical protein